MLPFALDAAAQSPLETPLRHPSNGVVQHVPPLCGFVEIVLSVSRLSWSEKIASTICVFLLVVYYVYAPSVLADHFDNSKMAIILGALLFLAVLSSLIQVVFKTSIVTEMEEGGFI